MRDYDPAEAAAVLALQALCQRDPDRYEAAQQEYLGKPKGLASVERPALTPNVAHSIKEAITIRSFDPAWDRVVSLADILRNFPPPGSKGEQLLNRLEIGPGQLREAIGQAIASAGHGREPDSPAFNDWVGTHRDEPAEEDELGRLGFARVLADRIHEDHRACEERQRQVLKKGGKKGPGPSAFIVHLHGPWGTGKSSVLNFLEKELGPPSGAWIVVKFNAWRDQRMQPPWWTLITAIHAAAREQLPWTRALKLRLRWLGWRMRADYLPVIAVATCILALALLVFWVGNPSDMPTPKAGSAPTNTGELFANWLDRLLKLVVAGITVVGGVIIWSRSLGMGSQRAAQAYADIKNDPYRPIARLFDRLVTAIDRPVAVFIDDLDRCDGKYVVELLEGIQTLMRRAPVTYVIAADRKWICASFQKQYEGFTQDLGEPGRPLGYLFLDKLFQISAAIPQLADEQRSTYWRGLLRDGGPDPDEGGESSADEATAEPLSPEDALDAAEKAVSGLTTQEQLREFVSGAEQSGSPVHIQAARAAAARRIASPHAARDVEHRLRRFSDLIEPNPRAMKRLVNAYGIHQASLFLAGRRVEAGALARWTIMELRWPMLADFLAQRPACVDQIAEPLALDALREVPTELRTLFGDEFVANVVALAEPDGLDSQAIRDILGAAHRER